MFASVHFSSTIVSDSRLYGVIGVVFTLLTWFIAMGAVVTLGAVVGVLRLKRRTPLVEGLLTSALPAPPSRLEPLACSPTAGRRAIG